MSEFNTLCKQVLEYTQEKHQNDESVLGYLDLNENSYFTEEKIGTFHKKGSDKKPKGDAVKVSIRSREKRDLPHVHLQGNNFKAAIQLKDAKYFIHADYTGKLNKSESELFDKFMRSISDDGKNSRWQFAVNICNSVFPGCIEITEQPDYTKLYLHDKDR